MSTPLNKAKSVNPFSDDEIEIEDSEYENKFTKKVNAIEIDV